MLPFSSDRAVEGQQGGPHERWVGCLPCIAGAILQRICDKDLLGFAISLLEELAAYPELSWVDVQGSCQRELHELRERCDRRPRRRLAADIQRPQVAHARCPGEIETQDVRRENCPDRAG